MPRPTQYDVLTLVPLAQVPLGLTVSGSIARANTGLREQASGPRCHLPGLYWILKRLECTLFQIE